LKKVLIITYYWPPSGGGGVQRWLKFAKYLSRFGWESIVYTPENPEVPSLDTSLLSEISKDIEIVKTHIWEPYSLYKRFIGKNKSEKINTGFLSESKKPKLTEDLSVWIRGNLFIPDARKFWISPSIRFLKEYLRKNPVDAIVSTGPPHSMHMIGLGIKKSMNIPWIADFRDPWTNIDFYDKLRLSRIADKSHHSKEQSVIQNADILTTVSWSWAHDFKKMGAKRVDVITNGFDPSDFKSISRLSGDRFELCHIGSMNKDRNPRKLWEAIAEVANNIKEFKDDLKITLLGTTDHEVFEDIKRLGLINQVEYISYSPHKEVLQRAANSTILLLPLNDTPNVSGIIPGKIFEYLALDKPILCVGPENGDSARIIKETENGETIRFSDKSEMLRFIDKYYSIFKNKNSISTKGSDISKYSRIELTKKMVQSLDSIVV